MRWAWSTECLWTGLVSALKAKDQFIIRIPCPPRPLHNFAILNTQYKPSTHEIEIVGFFKKSESKPPPPSTGGFADFWPPVFIKKNIFEATSKIFLKSYKMDPRKSPKPPVEECLLLFCNFFFIIILYDCESFNPWMEIVVLDEAPSESIHI